MLGAFDCLRHDLKRRRTTECRRQGYFQLWQDKAAVFRARQSNAREAIGSPRLRPPPLPSTFATRQRLLACTSTIPGYGSSRRPPSSATIAPLLIGQAHKTLENAQGRHALIGHQFPATRFSAASSCSSARPTASSCSRSYLPRSTLSQRPRQIQ